MAELQLQVKLGLYLLYGPRILDQALPTVLTVKVKENSRSYNLMY